jgi:hypothetical protein
MFQVERVTHRIELAELQGENLPERCPLGLDEIESDCFVRLKIMGASCRILFEQLPLSS